MVNTCPGALLLGDSAQIHMQASVLAKPIP